MKCTKDDDSSHLNPVDGNFRPPIPPAPVAKDFRPANETLPILGRPDLLPPPPPTTLPKEKRDMVEENNCCGLLSIF